MNIFLNILKSDITYVILLALNFAILIFVKPEKQAKK